MTTTTGDISALDRAFLCCEREAAPLHIGAIAVFEPTTLTVETLVDLLRERANRNPGLRLRVSMDKLVPGRARWHEDPDFRVEDHIRIHQLPSPGGQRELAALASELSAEPLESNRPLWEIHVICGLHDDRFAILIKLHHALADGRRAAEMGLSLLDEYADQHPQAPVSNTGSRTLPNPVRTTLRRLQRPERLIDDLRAAVDKAGAALRRTGESMAIAADVLSSLRLPASGSAMRAPASPARRVELLALDLRDLRRIRSRHGGTTNDVMLAIIAGGLRHWMAARGEAVDETTVRALLPVSHQQRDAVAIGNNQLSGYLCDLAVAEPDPAARLRLIRAAMHRNKSAGPMRGPGALPILASRMPSSVHQVSGRLAGGAAPLLFDTLITNVPLYDIPASLAGSRLSELYPLGPLAAGHSLAFAMTQFRGNVHIGIQANRFAVSDIEKLTDALPHAVTELLETC